MTRLRTSALPIISIFVSGMFNAAHAQLSHVADQQLTRAGGDAFGYDVALDGDRIVTGEFGHAFVYEKGLQGWAQVAELVPSGVASSYYGNSVELDGDRAFVGSHREGDGRVYVFELIAGSWQETAILVGNDGIPGGIDDYFGQALAIDEVTGKLAVGAPHDDTATLDGGAIYIYELQGTTWVPSSPIHGVSGASYAAIGGRFAIDGDRLVMTEYLNSGDTSQVHIYEPVSGVWTHQETLVPRDPSGTPWTQTFGFGRALALSGDTLVVTSPEIGVLVARGAGHVFEKGPSGWLQTDYLHPAMTADRTIIAEGVAIHGDRIVFGGHASGTTSMFVRVAPGEWDERALLSATGIGDHGGFGERMAYDGRTVVSAAWRADLASSSEYGAIYIHEDVQPSDFGRMTCPGDETLLLCPCNYDSYRPGGPGCLNSSFRGALLVGHGSPSLSGPGLAMTGFHLVPNAPCVIFSGANSPATPVVFGNGLLCVSPPIQRHAIKPTGPAGGVHFGAQDGLLNAASPGQVRTYQVWYRDPMAFCQGGFNLSNGFEFSVVP